MDEMTIEVNGVQTTGEFEDGWMPGGQFLFTVPGHSPLWEPLQLAMVQGHKVRVWGRCYTFLRAQEFCVPPHYWWEFNLVECTC